MTDGINGDFKVRQSEWQGYVRRALEEMTARQALNDKRMGVMQEAVEKRLDKMQELIDKRLDIIDNRLMRAQLKVAGLGGISGLLVSIVFFLLVYVFTGGN